MRPVLSLCLMLSACSPEADLPQAYREMPVPEKRLASQAAAERGRVLYLANCQLCHGVRADGHGVRRSALSAPPADLTNLSWQRRMTPRRLFAILREGKPGTPMPAWKALDDEQVWDLVAYLRSLGRNRDEGIAEDVQ